MGSDWAALSWNEVRLHVPRQVPLLFPPGSFSSVCPCLGHAGCPIPALDSPFSFSLASSRRLPNPSRAEVHGSLKRGTPAILRICHHIFSEHKHQARLLLNPPCPRLPVLCTPQRHLELSGPTAPPCGPLHGNQDFAIVNRLNMYVPPKYNPQGDNI